MQKFEMMEVTEEMLTEDGYTGDFAESWAGWYYSYEKDLYTLSDVFRDSWDSTIGPIRDNVIGPFGTEGAAEEDRNA